MSDSSPTPRSLADALPGEIQRVSRLRDWYLDLAREMGAAGVGLRISAQFIEGELATAVKAAASGCVFDMLASYEALKGYDDSPPDSWQPAAAGGAV